MEEVEEPNTSDNDVIIPRVWMKPHNDQDQIVDYSHLLK
jgi:hypothetical protein